MFSTGAHHTTAPGQGTTIRQPATSQILIDSLDRFPNGYPANVLDALRNSSSDWRLNLQQIVLNGYVTRIGVSEIQLRWNLPTIVQGYNSAFFVSYDGGAPVQVTIDPGWYDVDTMAAHLQNQINAATGGAFLVTWNAQDGVFEFDATAGHTVVFQDPVDATERRVYHTLGIVPDATPNQTYQGIQPTMLASRYIDICSSYLTKFQRLKDANTLPSNISTTCIARVYATSLNSISRIAGNTPAADPVNPGDAPFVVTVDYTFPKQIAWNPSEGISNFDIQLRDEEGELVPYVPPGYLYNGELSTPVVTPGAPGVMVEYNIVLLASED